MPWCEECSRFYNPNSLAPDGTCVRCGTFIAPTPSETEKASETKVPWHFWMLVVALAIYLGWRLVQGVMWVAGRF